MGFLPMNKAAYIYAYFILAVILITIFAQMIGFIYVGDGNLMLGLAFGMALSAAHFYIINYAQNCSDEIGKRSPTSTTSSVPLTQSVPLSAPSAPGINI